MYRLAPLIVFLVCVLLFISGARHFAPSPLELLLGRGERVEIKTIKTRIAAPQEIVVKSAETNETAEINASAAEIVETTETDADSIDADLPLEPIDANAPPTEEIAPPNPPTPPKLDALQKLLTNLGYPFASGDLQTKSCANGQTCAIDGVLRGLNFSELYCRAAAFAHGREMPKYAPNPTQSFEALQFWLSKKPVGLDAIYLASEPFVLSGSLYTERGALKGALSLSYNARWRFPCNIDEGWQNVSLPLRCAVRRWQNALDCSLDLRALIESLSGVAAKASEPERKKQIDDLRENLQEQFKHRIRERPNIEEIDLRYLF
ncbi:MAG: YeaH/YhbH family protein [Helicobacteraceae bacterium]|jgi:hypothetical protein|nr:YeaH/YhbH family protein [Helicobacteraceae bacterium]